MKGLEDQLLGEVVRKERPDLEEAKDSLVVSISNDKRQLKELEDKILKLLKESSGNILDDADLINTLNNSKVRSVADCSVMHDLKQPLWLNRVVTRAIREDHISSRWLLYRRDKVYQGVCVMCTDSNCTSSISDSLARQHFA